MRIIKFFSSLIISIFICSLFLHAASVNAAASTTLQINPVVVNVKAGEQFTLTTKAIPTAGKNYTVRFSIKFLPELVSVQRWNYADTWISINEPGYEELNNNTGVLVRTAGFPGGFDSVTNFGTATFLAKKTGVTSIFIDAESFSLDGLSSNTAIIGSPAIINITQDLAPAIIPVSAPIINPVPVPVVTPTPAPASVPVPEIPVAVPIILPAQLFDIKLNINDAILNKSSDLVAQLIFENFGTVTTPVELSYRILDSKNNEVYNEKGNVVVETEKVVTKDFSNLNLKNGKYTLIVATKYGANVNDIFKQVFEVKMSSIYGIKLITIALIGGGVVLITIGIVIYFIIRRKKK
ncbi:MAG: hypothetical protein PHU42_01820 [Patescibacteria group bacterium]|nr:hypothetical protein [Patescibacteria group bacterium]